MKAIVVVAIVALTLGGCAHNGFMSMPQSRYGFQPSMSTGVGIVDNTCGEFKFTDPACNPAMSAAGSN